MSTANEQCAEECASYRRDCDGHGMESALWPGTSGLSRPLAQNQQVLAERQPHRRGLRRSPSRLQLSSHGELSALAESFSLLLLSLSPLEWSCRSLPVFLDKQ